MSAPDKPPVDLADVIRSAAAQAREDAKKTRACVDAFQFLIRVVILLLIVIAIAVAAK